MSHSSKTKTQKSVKPKSINKLHEHITALENTLKTLMDTINQVGKEITALQALLSELAVAETESSPSTSKSSSDSGTPKTETLEKTTPKSEKKAIEVEKPATTSFTTLFLEAMNTLPIPELADKLKNASAKQNVISNIVKERKKIDFQKFASVEDIIIRIKGLAKPSLDKILEQWS